MPELENHTVAGIEWVKANPKAAEANMMILSAWNEHDEGHWIAPTLPKYGGAEKLEAIKRAIVRAGAAGPPPCCSKCSDTCAATRCTPTELELSSACNCGGGYVASNNSWSGSCNEMCRMAPFCRTCDHGC